MNEIRGYACVSVAAGLLRILSSFITYRQGNDLLELFYMVIDLGFILALLGFYLLYRECLGGIGRTGFVIGLCGFGLIAGPEATIFGLGIYQIGSPIIGLGMLLLSIGMWRAPEFGKLIPMLLAASVVVGSDALVLRSQWLFSVAGILFGSGFVAIGVGMWSRAKTGAGSQKTVF